MTIQRSSPSRAAFLGLALLAGHAVAQTTTTGSASGQTITTTIGTTGQTSTTADASFRDGKALIGANLSTTGGRYGTISDLVYDSAGAVRYALVQSQGTTHPVPFSLLQFGATGDVTIPVSSASLDSISIDTGNLQALSSASFLTQLRSAFGANVTRSLTNPAGIVPGTGNGNANPNSTAGQRSQLYSLNSLLGGNITAQGGLAGTIADVAIAPNGLIAYAVGTGASNNPATPNGTTQFAVPFAFAQVASGGNGLNVSASTQALMSVAIPQGTLPTFSNVAFAGEISSVFGSQANNLFSQFGNAATNSKLNSPNALERSVANRNDPFFSDPVVQAGNSSQAGVNAVAGAGDARRGGMNAVGRAGDRTAAPTVNTTSGAFAGTNSGTTTGATSIDGTTNSTVTGTTGGTTSGTAGVATSGTPGFSPNRPDAVAAMNRLQGTNSASSANNTTTNSGTTTAGTAGTASPGTATTASSGGIVNMPSEPPPSATGGNPNLIQMRDLLNFRVQASDGAFGRVSDIVFDRNGNVQYLVGSYQGQSFPLPFMPSAFSTNGNTLSFNVPISTLEQLAINPQNLPTLQNQAFVSRMQQVFGQSFGASTQSTSLYPTNTTTGTATGNNTRTTAPVTGVGAAVDPVGPHRPAGSLPAPNPFTLNRSGTTGSGATSGTGASSGTGTRTGTSSEGGTTSGSGTSGGSTSTGSSPADTWAWPTSSAPKRTASPTSGVGAAEDPWGPHRPAGSLPAPNPFTLNRNQMGTGTGAGIRANSGNTNNSGVGTGGRTINPPPNGRAVGRNRGGNGTEAPGASPATSGSGTTGAGATSGSGSAGGSGSTGGSGSGGGSGGSSGSGS